MSIKRKLSALVGISFLSLIAITFYIGHNTSKNNPAISKKEYHHILHHNYHQVHTHNDSHKLLDLKSFKYINQPQCNDSLVDYSNNAKKQVRSLWIITSYAGDPSKRSALRWAYNSNELKILGIRRIFLLGTLDDDAQKITGVSQRAIQSEANRFNDILQGNFIEAYKNLTYKHLMGLQWAIDKCSDSYSYIMKMDDDIIVNLYETMNLLKSKIKINHNEDFLMGYMLDNMTPIRNKANKWYVNNQEFSDQVYPAFLSGWFYWVNIKTALKLVYQSFLSSKYFWIDDLFITGILREKAGIHDIINVKEVFTTDYRFLICCLKNEVSFIRYKCDYIVGPDGGQSTLLSTFQKYSRNCYYRYNCINRPEGKLIKDKCILDEGNSNLEVGNAHIEEVNFENDS